MSQSDLTIHELSYWRDRIDRTDANLRQLIAKRMSCAREVARIKSEHEKRNPNTPVIYYRPGREAQMMRKLADQGVGQAGGFPAASLIQIWRELISASIEHQADGLRIAVDAPDAMGLARAHFGACSDIKHRDAPLSDLSQGKVMVAVLSWARLDSENLGDGQHVIAALPFVGTPTHAVVGAQTPEPSGDDRAVYRVEDQQGEHRHLSEGLVALPADAVAPTRGNPKYLGLFATPLTAL